MSALVFSCVFTTHYSLLTTHSSPVTDHWPLLALRWIGRWPLATPVAYAAIPSIINYQGRLTDSSGNAVTGSVTMTFRIYDNAASTDLFILQNAQTTADRADLDGRRRPQR